MCYHPEYEREHMQSIRPFAKPSLRGNVRTLLRAQTSAAVLLMSVNDQGIQNLLIVGGFQINAKLLMKKPLIMLCLGLCSGKRRWN